MSDSNDRMSLFLNGFSARDLAEALASFDESTSFTSIREAMNARHLNLVGVRRSGLVAGWLSRTDLESERQVADFRAFNAESVVSEDASLNEVVTRLQAESCLFVHSFGQVSGLICREDLQKPPMRMWLFGLITITELRTTHLIEQFCPRNSWREYLSDGRIEKAVTLQKERHRRGQHPTLLDCLQFADKGQIVARDERLRSYSRFSSRRAVEEFVRALQDLRNNLAHSQDILGDWDVIIELATNVHRIVLGPEPADVTLSPTDRK